MPIHATLRRLSILRPSRSQNPGVVGRSDPARGANGQNARRPPIRSSAGSKVSIATAATATPIAPTGPRPAVELTWASERQSSAAITVPAEATIAGPPCRNATRIATYLSSTRWSSSR